MFYASVKHTTFSSIALSMLLMPSLFSHLLHTVSCDGYWFCSRHYKYVIASTVFAQHDLLIFFPEVWWHAGNATCCEAGWQSQAECSEELCFLITSYQHGQEIIASPLRHLFSSQSNRVWANPTCSTNCQLSSRNIPRN